MALVEAVVAQIGEQVEDGAVEDDFACFDQFMADGLRQMAFADTGRANQKDVFGPVEEPAGGEVMDAAAVDGGVTLS